MKKPTQEGSEPSSETVQFKEKFKKVFRITINTDDTVSNKIISNIVSYIGMITNEKKIKPQGGKKSRIKTS